MTARLKKEDILNADKVFRRILYKSGIEISIELSLELRDGEDYLSMDWSEYSTAEETRDRMAKSTKEDTTKNGVISFIVGHLRDIHLLVKHDPGTYQAHTAVSDPKTSFDLKTRLIMADMCEEEIALFA